MKIQTPAPTINHEAIQSNASNAREAALKMLSTHKIDNTLPAPVEEGDIEPKEKVQVAEPEPGDEPEPEPKDGESDEPKEEDKPEPKEAKKEEPVDEKVPDPIKKSFERLARDKAELRREKEAFEAERKEVRAESAQLLTAKAAAGRRDALGVLASFGLSYKDAVAQLTGGAAGHDQQEPEERSAPEPSNEVSEIRAELNKLKFERGAEKLTNEMAALVKSEAAAFPIISGEPELVDRAREYLYQFIRETGAPPGENRKESVRMALEAVEAAERAETERHEKRKARLTGGSKSVDTSPVAPKSAGTPPASELGSSRKTLSNSHASSPKAAGSIQPKTVEELRAEAQRILEAQSKG